MEVHLVLGTQRLLELEMLSESGTRVRQVNQPSIKNDLERLRGRAESDLSEVLCVEIIYEIGQYAIDYMRV